MSEPTQGSKGATPQVKAKVTAFVIFASVIAAIGGGLFGYDTGVISGAILFIKQVFHLSPGQESFVTSAVLIGATIGAIVGGFTADRIGRRGSILGAATVFILGTFVVVLSNEISVLVAGRIIIGIAIGIASFTVPLYIAELAPTQMRGSLTSLNQLAVVIGILLSYVVDFAFSARGDWRAMFLVGLVPSSVLLLGVLLLPESPRWLLSKSEDDKAVSALKKLRGGTDVKAEVAETQQEIESEKGGGGVRVLAAKTLRWPVTIGLGLAILQQITGINTVIYFAPTIFGFAGLQSAQASIAATAGVGLVNLVFTIVSVFLVDRLGRRPLLLISTVGMTLSIGALGVVFALVGGSSSGGSNLLGILTGISLMGYIASFAIGMGPIFWLMIAEIYPLQIRGTAMSVATVANWASNWLMAATFLGLVGLIGQSGTFIGFAVVGALAFLFVLKLVPETKGRTLEQIQAHFAAGKHPRAL